MRLGISSYTYGWTFNTPVHGGKFAMDENELITQAASMGISLAQVGDNLPLDTFSTNRIDAFKETLKNQQMELELGARKMTPQHLERYIRISAEMHARILRFVVDDKDYLPSVKDIISIIRSQSDALEQIGVVLALENHDRFRAADLRHIIESAGSNNVGICLDTANSLGAFEQTSHVVETLAPYTVNLHIKDYGISRLPHGQGFIIDGRIAGEGMLDIPALIRNIAHFDRCQTCILEQWVPPDHKPLITLEKEKFWAAKSVTYLQNVLEQDAGNLN